jgi:hypothetical protein
MSSGRRTVDNIAKARPFKKVYCDRPEVFLLPPAAFKVWMYHYIREGQTRESWPSLPTICDSLGMNEETVKIARKFLVSNGWLKRVGEKNNRDMGKFKIPIFRVTRGTIPPKAEKPPTAKKAHRGGKSAPTVVEHPTRHVLENPPMDRGGKSATEVDSETQVDTCRSTFNEVDGFAAPLLYANSPMPELPEAGYLGKIHEPQAEKPPTVGVKDSFAGVLAYFRKERKWYADENIGRALTAGEVSEMHRRNTEEVTA